VSKHHVLIGLLFAGLAVTPLHSVTAQNAAPHRVTGHGFSIPIPPGFAPVDSANDDFARWIWRGGGVMIAQEHAPLLPNPELASIIVATSPGGDLADPDSCAAFASGQTRHATLLGSGLVGVGGRQACRFTSTRRTDVPGVTASQVLVVASTGDGRLTFVCTYDPRDAEALKACEFALNGWEFADASPRAH
jgi:hypothetical protein